MTNPIDELIEAMNRGSVSLPSYIDHPQITRALTSLQERRDALFDAIQHGDQDHKDWLREAIAAHFAGEPVPAPRGAGNNEAMITSLQERNRKLEEALKPFALAADDLDDDHRDGSEIWEAAAAMSITAGDLRNIRALLSGAGE